MKTYLKHIILSVCLIAAGNLSVDAQAKKDTDWKQKMMNEKIAFLTNELQITPQEAQAFWPVYNEVNKEKDEAMHRIFGSYRKLNEALKAEKPSKEVEKLLKSYLDALQVQRDIDSKAADRFMDVLPAEKVARLYVAEERFRRQQIHKLHHGNHQEKR